MTTISPLASLHGQCRTMNDKKCSPLSLPQEVKDAVTLRNPLIAWTKLDPDFENDIGSYFCCLMFGPFAVCPCFWPHLLIIWPCLLSGKVSATNNIKNMYWLLTTND